MERRLLYCPRYLPKSQRRLIIFSDADNSRFVLGLARRVYNLLALPLCCLTKERTRGGVRFFYILIPGKFPKGPAEDLPDLDHENKKFLGGTQFSAVLHLLNYTILCICYIK